MTIKERKEELKKEFNASAEEFVKNYKVFERMGFELDGLKRKQASEVPADDIAKKQEKYSSAFKTMRASMNYYEGIRKACRIMLTEKEFEELEFFAPHL